MLREREREKRNGGHLVSDLGKEAPCRLDTVSKPQGSPGAKGGNSSFRPSALESGPKMKVGLAVRGTVENWKALAETFTMLAPRA